jgi:hypothetical protein
MWGQIKAQLGQPEVVGSFVQATATVLSALIVGLIGALIAARHARERDRQDREAQWRSHAVELTKLDLERKLKTREPADTRRLRPSILDFLANYRDLQELGGRSAADLYDVIRLKRIAAANTTAAPANASDTQSITDSTTLSDT